MATAIYDKEERGEVVVITHVFSHMEQKIGLGSVESLVGCQNQDVARKDGRYGGNDHQGQ